MHCACGSVMTGVWVDEHLPGSYSIVTHYCSTLHHPTLLYSTILSILYSVVTQYCNTLHHPTILYSTIPSILNSIVTHYTAAPPLCCTALYSVYCTQYTVLNSNTPHCSTSTPLFRRIATNIPLYSLTLPASHVSGQISLTEENPGIGHQMNGPTHSSPRECQL